MSSSQSVWSVQIAIHTGFVEELVCNKCHNIPKQGFGRVCDNNHIYCSYCIQQLIGKKSSCLNPKCNINRLTQSKLLPKVLQHMIDELKVICPNKCSWNGKLSLLSHHILQCNDSSSFGMRRRIQRISSDTNIVYNDNNNNNKTNGNSNNNTKQSKKKKFIARRRTSSTTTRTDALKEAEKFKSSHKPHKTLINSRSKNKNKKNKFIPATSVGCPLLSVGCGYRMDIKNTNKMDDHFKEYQHKHLMLIINDYEHKFQKLENSVQFLQSQMQFVLNELSLAQQTIQSQSDEIQYLNDKLNVNIMNQTKKPPKKSKSPSTLKLNIDTKTRLETEREHVQKDKSPSPSPIPPQSHQPHHFKQLYALNNNKRIAMQQKYNYNHGKRKFSSASLIGKTNENKMRALSEDYKVNENGIENDNDIQSDTNSLIIDNGSGFIKYGFGNDTMPQIFPTIVGKFNKFQQDANEKYYIGNDAIKNEKFINLESDIITNGIINDWDKMEKIWEYIFKNKLKIDVSKDIDLMIMSESLMNETENREKLTQIMFETFNVKSFYLSPDVVLSLHGSGNLNGTATVIESGYDHTTICPIFEGIPFKLKSINIDNISGKSINEWLENNLKYKLSLNNRYNQKISKYKKQFIINHIKENICYISNCQEIDDEILYKLPDGYNIFNDDEGNIISSIWCNEERFRCTEKCVMSRLPDLIYKSIESCPNAARSVLYDKIILSGGNTMFDGFDDRIKLELMKNNIHNYNINIFGNSNKNQNENRQYQVWKGGSIISSINTINEIVIHKSEYIEYGDSIVSVKCV